MTSYSVNPDKRDTLDDAESNGHCNQPDDGSRRIAPPSVEAFTEERLSSKGGVNPGFEPDSGLGSTTTEPSPDVALPAIEKQKEEKSKEKKEKPKVVSLRQLFRFADRIDYLLMISGTICACGHGVAMPMLLIIFGTLTDDFVNTGTATVGANFTWKAETQDDFLTTKIRPKCVDFVILGICVLFVAYGQVAFWLTTSHRQASRIRQQYLQAVLRQEIGWFDTNDAGEIGIRLTDDINKIQAGIGDKFGAFFQFLSTFIVGIIIALVKGWKLALVILSTTPLLAGCGGVMMFLITASTKKESEAYAKAGAIAEEDLSAIRTVVVFGGEEKECNRYNDNLKFAKTYGIRKSMVNGGGMGVTYLIIFSTYALAFWYGGTLTMPKKDENGVYHAEYTLGQLLVVFFCAVFGAMSLGNASPNVEFIATARGSAYCIWNIIDRVSEIDSLSDSGLKPNSLTGNIEIVDVNFKYPSRPEIKVEAIGCAIFHKQNLLYLIHSEDLVYI